MFHRIKMPRPKYEPRTPVKLLLHLHIRPPYMNLPIGFRYHRCVTPEIHDCPRLQISSAIYPCVGRRFELKRFQNLPSGIVQSQTSTVSVHFLLLESVDTIFTVLVFGLDELHKNGISPPRFVNLRGAKNYSRLLWVRASYHQTIWIAFLRKDFHIPLFVHNFFICSHRVRTNFFNHHLMSHDHVNSTSSHCLPVHTCSHVWHSLVYKSRLPAIIF